MRKSLEKTQAKELESIHVKVWKVTVKNEEVKVATIEHESRKPSMCEGCSAPCCQGHLRPVLTEEEFKTRRFPTKFLPLPEWLRKEGVKANYIATLAMPRRVCSYFDPLSHKCLLWPDAPKACLSYDCREDPRMKEFVRERMREWENAQYVTVR